MIDRCAGCGCHVTPFACCSAAYWSQRKPEAGAEWFPMICVAGYYLYGWPNEPNIQWSPADAKPIGFHPGHPPFLIEIYRGHLRNARARWGTARVLVHRREIILTLAWARGVLRHRAKRRHAQGISFT